MAHKSKSLLVVDNCFCTPAHQLPIQFGADVIIHSLNSTRLASSGEVSVVGGTKVNVKAGTTMNIKSEAVGTLLFSATGIPFSNSISIISCLSGAFSILDVHENASSGGASHVSSKSSPSIARPHKFLSIEYTLLFPTYYQSIF